MPSQALVQLFGERPAFIRAKSKEPVMWFWRDGSNMVGHSNPCIISVSTHDQYYRETTAAWKRKIKALSDEKSSGLRKAIADYQSWKKKEEAWYKEHGLTIPSWSAKLTKHKQRRKYKGPTCSKGHIYSVTGVYFTNDKFRRCSQCRKEFHKKRQKLEQKHAEFLFQLAYVYASSRVGVDHSSTSVDLLNCVCSLRIFALACV